MALALSSGRGFPIIKRSEHPQEWRDWYAYYGFRRMLASQEMMRRSQEKTVPTLTPFDFDAEFNPRLPSPEVPHDGWGPPIPQTEAGREMVRRLHKAFREGTYVAKDRSAA